MEVLNYIDGQFSAGASWLDVIEPATGTVYGRVVNSGKDDIEKAVAAARKAGPSWAALPVSERAAYLMDIARRIDEDLENLAMAESRDNGKPLTLARGVDIPRASKNMRFYATAIQHFSSEAHQTGEDVINFTLRQPLGVVGCISPWNLPLYLFTWKIAPALAAGNTVVAKPSELTPVTAYLFSRICEAAGLPAGVLNVVHGEGASAGEVIVTHPKVRAISFTGGTVTGRRIAALAAPELKKLSLELGGKNPTLVFADCDFQKTVSQTAQAAFANQGEICLCGSRILVEKSIYDKFKKAFVSKVNQLKVGDPEDGATQIGALVSRAHLDKVAGYVRLAREEGGIIETGGNTVDPGGRCTGGYFHEPTVITNLPMSCRTNQEEIFGPVVTIQPFEDLEDALELANDCRYGLSASIWTSNLQKAHRAARGIDAGIIWVNCWLLRDLRTPFGGMKQSGMGREGGWYALEFFSEPKNVCIKY